MDLTIGYLYGDLMNIYGDTGNIICLQKRCEWRGISIKVQELSIKDKIKSGEIDLYFFGGGQDQSQAEVAKDLVSSSKNKVLREDIERGIPILSICGGYQLLGEYYAPFEGPKLEGLGIFPTYTKASHERMIGNLVVKTSDIRLQTSDKTKSDDRRLRTDDFLVGFENHSGKTYLKEGGKSLGKVIKGFGNNGADGTEGCIYKNAIGCYMHGSLLPKNPQLADWLIKKALEVKYGKIIELKLLEDSLENQAHETVIQRFR